MNVCNLSYNASVSLYERDLNIIGDKSFTKRQIDIIACIVHMRGDSEIAKILDLSVRTIGSHVYGIYKRFDNVNSRDGIRNFAEKSGKLPIIREYYLYLMLNKEFQAKLKQIKASSRGRKFKYKLYVPKHETENKTLKQLQDHLNITNIILAEDSDDKYNAAIFVNEIDESKLNSYNVCTNYLLVIEEGKESMRHDAIETVYFYQEEEYYLLVLQLINKLLQSNASEAALKEFVDAAETLQQLPWTIVGNKQVNVETPEKNYKKFLIAALCLSIILTLSVTLYPLFTNNKSGLDLKHEDLQRETADIKKALKELVVDKKVTANNIGNRNNAPYMKKLEKMNARIEQIGNLYYEDISLDDFLLYLNANYALANYYTYHMHDGQKAYRLLLFIKSKIYKYLEHHDHRFKPNETEAHNAEIIHELHKYEHLGEIYARILYSLGRTYFYNTISQKESSYYLTLSNKLANSNNLFEEYLSKANGLLWISIDKAQEDIKNGNTDMAKLRLEKIISEYDTFLASEKSYIVDYGYQGSYREVIQPSKDERCVSDCLQKKAKCYSLLMKINPSHDNFAKALSSITQMKVDGKFIDNRRVAVMLNSLGFFLLEAKELGINYLKEEESQKLLQWFNSSDKLRSKISMPSNLLELANHIFTLSLTFSGQWEHSKAVSYEGLYKVQVGLDLEKAMAYKAKANNINRQIGRKEID